MTNLPIYQLTLLAGLCTYANPGVLDRVAAYRDLAGACPDCIGYVAVADCAYLGRRVWLHIGGELRGPLLSVDCGQAAHRAAQQARRLVADLDRTDWQQLGLPNRPVPCSLTRIAPRPLRTVPPGPQQHPENTP